MFIGRDEELTQLRQLLRKKRSSLAVCRGRRRIGKSTLIQEFGKEAKSFYEFQGLPPRQGMTNTAQLANFSSLMARQFGLPNLRLVDWSDAFALLASQIRDAPTVVLLDEVSWLAAKDPDFAGKLKIAWDTKLKKCRHLILILCGSVSSWIDRNILHSAGFVGRVSLTVTLQELPLNTCSAFWGRKAKTVSDFEKFKLLAITGGIPRYLEEIDPSMTAENNIKAMCFSPAGFLFREFDLIFQDTFGRRAPMYGQLIDSLTSGGRSFSEICGCLGVSPNGVITEYLADLEESGFIARDYVYSPTSGKRGKLSKYRLKDNYVRFYLKYIQPHADGIEKGLFKRRSVESLPAFDSIMGLQLENLVLNNLPLVLHELDIPATSIVSASPYFQNATNRHKACQIDLLVRTKSALFVCEVRFRRRIQPDVVTEVQRKVEALERPRHLSMRPILIHLGKLSPRIEDDGYFDRIISLQNLL